MPLCICAGLFEIGALIVAALLPVFPFLRNLYKRRNKHRRSDKDCCPTKKRIPYVVSADLIRKKKP